MGYSEQEVIGKHHRIFCDALYAQSSSYAQFWEQLRQGHSHSGIYQRIDKHGRELWLEATYFPVKVEGKVVRVIKIASDITESYQQLSQPESDGLGTRSGTRHHRVHPRGRCDGQSEFPLLHGLLPFAAQGAASQAVLR
ncbi:PAS domain-containing protein [Aeromonas hydrophila]